MGYSLYPFAVSIDKVKEWLGDADGQQPTKKTDDEIATFLDKHGAFLDGIDKIRPGPNVRTIRQCFDDMRQGRRPYDATVAYKYNYVAYALCEYEGERLGIESAWYHFRLAWFDRVDEAWRTALELETDQDLGWTSLQNVANRGNPFKLPHPIDFPGVGRLRFEAIQGLQQHVNCVEADWKCGQRTQCMRRGEHHEQYCDAKMQL